jgi:hypothetical protein
LAICEEGSDASCIRMVHQRLDQPIVEGLSILVGSVRTVDIVLGRLEQSDNY